MLNAKLKKKRNSCQSEIAMQARYPSCEDRTTLQTANKKIIMHNSQQSKYRRTKLKNIFNKKDIFKKTPANPSKSAKSRELDHMNRIT